MYLFICMASTLSCHLVNIWMINCNRLRPVGHCSDNISYCSILQWINKSSLTCTLVMKQQPRPVHQSPQHMFSLLFHLTKGKSSVLYNLLIFIFCPTSSCWLWETGDIHSITLASRGRLQFHTWLDCFTLLKLGTAEVCVLGVLLVYQSVMNIMD